MMSLDTIFWTGEHHRHTLDSDEYLEVCRMGLKSIIHDFWSRIWLRECRKASSGHPCWVWWKSCSKRLLASPQMLHETPWIHVISSWSRCMDVRVGAPRLGWQVLWVYTALHSDEIASKSVTKLIVCWGMKLESLFNSRRNLLVIQQVRMLCRAWK